MTDLFSCTTVEQNGLKLWGSGAFFLPAQGMYYPVSVSVMFLLFRIVDNNESKVCDIATDETRDASFGLALELINTLCIIGVPLYALCLVCLREI